MAEYAKADWAWLREPLSSSLEYIQQCSAVMHSTMHGFNMIENARGLHEALDNFDRESGDWEKNLEERLSRDKFYKEILKFVHKEKVSGYFIVISQSTLALWVELEAAITDTVISIMKNNAKILLEEPFSQVKFSYGAFVNLDEQQLRYLVLSQVENRQEIRNAQGVDWLEKLLAVVGLSGPVPKRLKKDILELQAIRNLIVHRRGITDPTFRRVCAWRRDKVGTPVKLTQRHYQRYEAATMKYVLSVANRLRISCGLKRISSRRNASVGSKKVSTRLDKRAAAGA
jgi:hypothetical protein